MKNQKVHFWPMQKWKHPKQRCMVFISSMQQGRSYAKRREWKTTKTRLVGNTNGAKMQLLIFLI
jgi:hypothetical protein